MNRSIVHAGKRTLYTWWKSMIEVAVRGTAAPVLLCNALHWPQTSSGQRVGLCLGKNSPQTINLFLCSTSVRSLPDHGR